MQIKKYVIVLGLVVAAFSAGRFSAPKSVQKQQSESTVKSKHENIDRNQNVDEIVKEVVHPDGTVEREIHKQKQTSTQTTKHADTALQRVTSEKNENRPSYRLGLIYQPIIRGFQNDQYSIQVERRLVSEIYLGISVSSRQTVGLVVSLGF